MAESRHLLMLKKSLDYFIAFALVSSVIAMFAILYFCFDIFGESDPM
jgi:hypothetical protein